MVGEGDTAKNSLSARWYDGVVGLRQLESDWRTMSAEADLFARYEWHLAAAMHLVSDGEKICFCRIGDDTGQPIAIIPAIAGRTEVKPFGTLAAVGQGWDNQLAVFDFPMARGANARAVGQTMLKAFKNHLPDWRVIAWPRVMGSGNSAKVALALGKQLADIVAAAPSSTFYTASVPDPAAGFEVYVVKSSKLRSNLANRTRRLAAHGPIEMRMGRQQGDIARYFDEFLRLESSGWKGGEGTSTAIALVPAARGFYSSLLEQSNSAFETDVALLFCGDKVVAGQFLVRTARWEHIYKIAYDESFSALSPGQLLHQQVIEHAKVSDGIDRVSLVTGQTWHKEWTPIPEPTLQIHIFRSVWRSYVIRLGRRAVAAVRQMRTRLKATQSKGVSSPG
jgi:CelD/BcsL family acetyltransferase involved in cellulose biosynthesis